MKKITGFCICLLALFSVGCSDAVYRLMAKRGTEFTVRIDTKKEDKKATVDLAIRVINSKMRSIGLHGDAAADPSDADRMIVTLYGDQDFQKEKAFLFTPYSLELRKLVSPPSPSPMQTFPSRVAAEAAATAEQEVFPFAESEGKFVIVERSLIVNGDDIRSASAERAGFDYKIIFSLKPAGAAKFGEWTGKNINNYLAVVLDNKVESAAYIKSQIAES